MRQEPVCHKDNHSKSTELSDSTIGKASDDTQDSIIGATFQGVGCSSPTQASRDTVFHGQGDWGGVYGIDLQVWLVV